MVTIIYALTSLNRQSIKALMGCFTQFCYDKIDVNFVEMK